MDIVYFTLVAIALYFGADRLLDWIERKRGARFENRQVVFFAIMLPLALAAFWLMRGLSGPGP
jgi:predicted PurR-regulated permease PerM